MYKVKANQSSQFEIKPSGNKYLVNDALVNFDCIKTSENQYHILMDNKSFDAELISIDYNAKTFHLRVNHKNFHLELSDDFDLLLIKMGIDLGAEQKITELKAPMPGLVLSIMVSPGDVVKAGSSLLVLEAMKMENVLPSVGAVTIDKILVKPGDKVDKNQALITFQ